MANPMGIVRKVDELGRIVLPAEIRRMLHIEEEDGLSVTVDPDNATILLKCQAKSCLRCGARGKLLPIRDGYYLCPDCAAAINRALEAEAAEK